MIKLSFKLNGRAVPPNRLAQEMTKQLQSAARQAATSAVERRVASIRCPVHHQQARIERTGPNGERRVRGCCDQLIAAVQERLR